MYNDELYHWKYIKKVKKNGKWRYYYDKEKLMKDAEKLVDRIDAKNGTILTDIRKSRKDYELYQDLYNSNKRSYLNDSGNWLSKDDYKTIQGKLYIKASEASLNTMKLQQAYLRTPAGKVKAFIRKIRQKIDSGYDENYSSWTDRITGVESMAKQYDTKRINRKKRDERLGRKV